MFRSLLQSFRTPKVTSSSPGSDGGTRALRERLTDAVRDKRYDEAVMLLGRLESLEPTAARWPHKRGDLLHQLRRDEHAFIAYATAVRLYAEAGHTERARAMAKAALTTIPNAERRLAQLDSATQETFHSVSLHDMVGVATVLE